MSRSHHEELPNLTVQQLLYVQAVLRATTWTEAAAALGVTQSALSQGLAEIERRVGVALFDKDRRRRIPTEAMRLLSTTADSVLAQIGDLRSSLDELSTGSAGSLRVGMIDTAALGPLSERFSRFTRTHAGVDTTLLVAPSAELTQALLQGELDVAVVVSPNRILTPQRPALVVKELITEPIFVYTDSAEAAGRPRHRWGPWVSYPAGSQTRELITTALRRRGIEPEIVAESSNPDVLRQMVRLGIGWCALPQQVAERPSSGVIHRVPGPPLATRQLALVRRRRAIETGTVDAFWTAMSDVAVKRPGSRARSS